ncbi:carboxylesterase/lipase family protein [Bacteroidota bacterium]
MHFSRRRFISRIPIITTAIATAPLFSCSDNATNDTGSIVADTRYGKLKGSRSNGVNTFKGVPYAGSVSGKQRFLNPAPLEPWTGIRDALQLGHPSIQEPNQTYGINEPDHAEDCLTLNIWTPANDNNKRPVMVYNHGGGFVSKSAGSTDQDGANLARLYDVVVVASNHRLSLLGYLYLDELAGGEYIGSGNRGMQDIVHALSWVKENISQFGGDPENVMIFGESGGGAKTSCLYAMPEAAPYFNKASIESGPGVRMTPRETAAETTSLVLKELNISPNNWQRLLEVSAEDLLSVQTKLGRLPRRQSIGGFDGIGSTGPGGFGPVVDGVVLPQHPFDPVAPGISKDKPLMVGWNEDEFIFFAKSGDLEAFKLDEEGLKERISGMFGKNSDQIFKTYKRSMPDASPSDIYIAIGSIVIMGLGSINIAEKKVSQQRAPAYLYNFGYKSEVKIPDTEYTFGAMHALDIPFKFHNVESNGMAGKLPERFKAADNMSEMWATFARTGKPGAEGQSEWPAYNMTDRPTMRIDVECEVINDRHSAERQMWEDVLKQ